jgi:hypothetical protein
VGQVSGRQRAHTAGSWLIALTLSPLCRPSLRVSRAETYEEYRALCADADRLEGAEAWREEERDLAQAVVLNRTIEELDDALARRDTGHLRFMLGGLFRVGLRDGSERARYHKLLLDPDPLNVWKRKSRGDQRRKDSDGLSVS